MLSPARNGQTTNGPIHQPVNSVPPAPPDQTNPSNAEIFHLIMAFRNEFNVFKNDMDGIREDLAAVKLENAEIMRQNAGIVKDHEHITDAIAFFEAKYEDVKKELATVKNISGQTTKEASETGKVAEAHEFHLHRIEGEVNKFHQQKLINNLVITGFAKVDSPEATFWALIQQLKANVQRNDVSTIQILNAKPTSNRRAFKTFTLLVSFANHNAKVELIKKKREAGVVFTDPEGTQRRRQIYIRDHLTKYGIFLFEKAQEFKNEFQFKFLWSRDGRILLCNTPNEKTFEINSLNDLQVLYRTQKRPPPYPKPSPADATGTIAPGPPPPTPNEPPSLAVTDVNGAPTSLITL